MKINQYFITNDVNVSFEIADFNLNSIDDYKIFSHNNLKVNCFEFEENEIIILGDIYDSFNAGYSIEDIGNILVKLVAFDDLLQMLDKHTGRFVIFSKFNNTHHIVSDFFCQRQVFYRFNDDNFYASSSDKLLLDSLHLELEIDDKKKHLSRSNYFLKIHEHWFLDNTDWDHRFKKLLPNHFLNINKSEVLRIPVYTTLRFDKKAFEKEFLIVLKNSIEAYSDRYNLMLGLTSGYDSRLLMTSSLTLKNIIKYFTFSRKDTYVKRDVNVAKKLSETYNLNYSEIIVKDLSKEFKSEFELQFLVPRILDKTKNIQWYKNQAFEKTANISGFGGELIRGFYHEENFKNIESICKTIEYEVNQSNTDAIDSWLKSARIYVDENNLLINDLFYLEVRLGKWGNKMVHEMDFASVEEFTPYNNRYLLFSLLLNYNADERKTIILNLLEQSLEGITDIPINPKTWKDTVKRIIFYKYYKQWIQKIK
jgi:hypothetical protein